VFAAGLMLTVVHVPQRAHADNVCTPDSSWGTVNSSFASQVVALVNQHRAAIGIGQLAGDGTLTRSAVWKSMNMAGLNYFDHNDDPIGRTPGQRLVACGWPSNLGWGENIAYGYSTPASVMSAWLNSPGHKANIENPSYTSIGVGVAANAQGIYYWTQDFGQGSSGGSPPPVTTTPPPPATTTPPPATTTPPPATTAPATTARSTTTTAAPEPPKPATSTTVNTAPAPVRADAAVPKVHKAKKPKAKKPKVRKLHRARRSTIMRHVPRGYLNLHELRHL
jgi:uncharacterized protein YkwD